MGSSKNVIQNICTCVLIEDNEDHAFLIQKAIDKCHMISLERVFDGAKDALAYLSSSEKRPDILFVDINLPDMNGFECIEALRENEVFRDMKIVVLTTSDVERDRKRAEELKVDSYITKPLRTQRLVSLLSELQFVFNRL